MCVGLSVFPLVVNECDPPSCPCLSIAHRNSQMTASMNHIYEYFSVWEESSDFSFVTSSTAAGHGKSKKGVALFRSLSNCKLSRFKMRSYD